MKIDSDGARDPVIPGLDVLDKTAGELMRRDYPAIPVTARRWELLRLLEESDVRAAVVTDADGTVLGLASAKALRAPEAAEIPYLPLTETSDLLISPSVGARALVRRIVREETAALVVVGEDRALLGVVTAAELEPVRQAVMANMCDPIFLSSSSEGLEPPSRDLGHADGCTCAILLFAAEGTDAELIDAFTGKYGYSHTAIDCCEESGGRRVIIEAVKNGIQRSFLDHYGTRKYVRIPLKAHGIDCEEVCKRAREHLGDGFDFGGGLSGTHTDPNKNVCSGLAFDALPEWLRQHILAWLEWDRRGRKGPPPIKLPGTVPAPLVHDHEQIYPNELAKYFGAPTPENIGKGTVVLPAPHQPGLGDCLVKVTLLEVVYTGSYIGSDWKYEISVQGGPLIRIPEHKMTKDKPDRLGSNLYEQLLGYCSNDVQVHISVTATECDAVDDVGSNSRVFKLACPGQYVDQFNVQVRERGVPFNDGIAILVFKFNFELRCY
jgi:hypothetical protein